MPISHLFGRRGDAAGLRSLVRRVAPRPAAGWPATITLAASVVLTLGAGSSGSWAQPSAPPSDPSPTLALQSTSPRTGSTALGVGSIDAPRTRPSVVSWDGPATALQAFATSPDVHGFAGAAPDSDASTEIDAWRWIFGTARLVVDAERAAATLTSLGGRRTSLGGEVALRGRRVRGEVALQRASGRVVMAAAPTLTLVDSMTPNVAVRVDSGADEIVDPCSLRVGGGRVDLHAGAVNQRGILRADTMRVGAGGELILEAAGRGPARAVQGGDGLAVGETRLPADARAAVADPCLGPSALDDRRLSLR